MKYIKFMNMIEIGLFILPDKKLAKEVLKWKKLFEIEFGNQLYLSHLPHITLGNFLVSNQEIFIKKIQDICENFEEDLNIEINDVGEFKEASSENATPHFIVKKSNNLIKFQENLIYKTSHITKSKFENNFINPIYKRNNRNYGYPYIGNSWIPHLTICTLKEACNDNNLKNKFLNLNPNYSFSVNSIYVFEVNNDNHIELDKININVR
tara:strand:- start:233 stop:859 length:627 start_codon:yes stop_codon:yes gene_type:complete